MSNPTPKTGLIIIAHGSRDPKWRQPFADFVNSMQSDLQTDAVELAYMEITSPTLLEAAQTLISRSITSIKILPFFMASGGHVDKDIPAQILDIQARFPEIIMEQLAPIGEHIEIRDMMKEVVKGLVS